MQSGRTWSRILDFNQDKPSSGNSVTWLIGRPGQTQNKPTLANWLGRSRFAADPYYQGYMDDFRIYNRVLTGNEIQKLYRMKHN